MPSEFRVDHLAVRRHRSKPAAFGDGGAMEIDRLGGRESQESFERDEDDAEVIELANDWQDIGHEVERRDDVTSGEHRD